jgi:hypothetical protein
VDPRRLKAACISLLIAFTTPTLAVDAPTLTWGGRLTDGKGKPLDGPVDLRISFHASETGEASLGGAPLEVNGVALKQGVFSVPLTLHAEELHAIFSDPSLPVYVQVTDATHGVTYPRQRLSATPYALKVPVDGQSLTYDAYGRLTVNFAANDTALLLKAGSSGKSVELRAPAGLGANVAYTLPAAPVAGGILTTDADGKFSWTTVAAAGGAIAASDKAAANGVATLNGSSKVVQDPANA